MTAHRDSVDMVPLGASDTPWEVEAVVIDGFRNMPGWQKLDRMRELNRLGLALAMCDIRARHPDAGERECLMRLASRCHGRAIMHALCDWDGGDGT